MEDTCGVGWGWGDMGWGGVSLETTKMRGWGKGGVKQKTKTFRLKGQSPPDMIFQTESLVGGRGVVWGSVWRGEGAGEGGGAVTSQQAPSSSSRESRDQAGMQISVPA